MINANDPNEAGGPYPDFENDLDLLCEDVIRGLAPKVARTILAELIQKHRIPDLLFRKASAELESEIQKIYSARDKNRRPVPDPTLNPSFHEEFEKRVRRRFRI